MTTQFSISRPAIKVIRHPSSDPISKPVDNRIAITVENMIKLIDIKTISHFHAESNYTWIHLNSGESILISKTLKKFEHRVSSHQFMRVHQSSLINLAMISSLDLTKNTIILTTGAKIPLARSKKSMLVQYLKNFSA